MRNIIRSLVIVVAVAAVASVASYATFSAQDTIDGNVVTTGTVTLVAHNFSGNKPIGTTIEKLSPGQWTADGRAELYNTGSLPVKLYMYVQNLNGSACSKTRLEVKTGYAGGDEAIRTVYSGLLANVDSYAERRQVTGDPPFLTLLPNWSQVIHQRAQLDSSADNSYQNTSCSWDEVFVAESVVPS